MSSIKENKYIKKLNKFFINLNIYK